MAMTKSQLSIRRNLWAGIAVALLLVGSVGVWGATTEISGAVIAPGAVVVDTHLRKVQHLTGGIIGEILARDLLRDEALHLPQCIEHTVVEVAAIHEWRQQQVEHVARKRLPREQPRFHVGVPFPVSAVLHEIAFERAHADDQRPARAERPQAGVDAKDRAVDGLVVEQLDDELRKPHEPCLRGRAPLVDALGRLRGALVVGVDEHEIDVGREIELAAAEFAHRERDQRQRFTARVARRRETRRQASRGVLDGRFDRKIGERGQRGETGLERRPAGQVVPRDSRHLDSTPVPERGHRRGFTRAVEPRLRVQRFALKRCAVEHARDQLLRIAGEGKSGEIEYRLKGKLSTKVGMLRTIPFDERGRVSASDFLGKRRGGGSG